MCLFPGEMRCLTAIAVDKLGNIAMPYNSGGMFRGFLYKEKGSPEIKKGCGIGKKIVVVGEK